MQKKNPEQIDFTKHEVDIVKVRSRAYKRAGLMVPLFMGFVWFAGLVVSSAKNKTEVALAPGRLNILVTFLFGFIIVYSIFLFYALRWLNENHVILRKKTRH